MIFVSLFPPEEESNTAQQLHSLGTLQMVGKVEEMSELKENIGMDESLDLQNICKVLAYWRVSYLVCLFSLPEVQESFSCEVMLCLSAQLKGNERKKQLGEGLRSAWRVVALRRARLKQLYNHSLVSCPQNSFMLSWVNLTMYHPLFYRGKHTKIYYGTDRRAEKIYRDYSSCANI